MKNQLHVIAIVLFAICFLYDIVVWGGVPTLPGVGTFIADSAHRETPLATTYIAIGTPLDAAMPSLGDYANLRLDRRPERWVRSHQGRSDRRDGSHLRHDLESDASDDQGDVLGRADHAAGQHDSLGPAPETGARVPALNGRRDV